MTHTTNPILTWVNQKIAWRNQLGVDDNAHSVEICDEADSILASILPPVVKEAVDEAANFLRNVNLRGLRIALERNKSHNRLSSYGAGNIHAKIFGEKREPTFLDRWLEPSQEWREYNREKFA